MKLFVFLILTFQTALLFGNDCSGLIGEYKLVETVLDESTYDNCPEDILIYNQEEKLILGGTDGVIYERFQKDYEKSYTKGQGPVSTYNFEKSDFSSCHAKKTLRSMGTAFVVVPLVSLDYLKLELDESDILTLESKNSQFSNGKLTCVYKKKID